MLKWAVTDNIFVGNILAKFAAILGVIFLVVSPAPGSSTSIDEILNGDYEAMEQPLSPDAAPGTVATVSAKLGYLWTLPDNCHAMVLMGNFRLQLPEKTLTSQDAVVWITPSEKAGIPVKRIDVFMEGGAQVIEASGTIKDDQVLYVTFYTSARIELAGDDLTSRNGSNLPVYQRALQAKSKGIAPTTQDAGQMVVHSPTSQPAKPEKPRTITIQGSFVAGPKIDDIPVLIFQDGVYLIQSGEAGSEVTELRAKNAVVFLKKEAMKGQGPDKEIPASQPGEHLRQRYEALPTEEEAAKRAAPQGPAGISEKVAASAVYLEGDVVLTRGYRQIRADQIYYNLENAKAFISNLVASTFSAERGIPVYIRAKEAYQLSDRNYVAKDAKISTSEFYTPSYYVGATTVYFEDRTERTETGEQISLAAGRFQAYNAALNVEGLPILYWPYLRGDFKASETAIRRIRFASDSKFGITGETAWQLFTLLGLDEPKGTDGTLLLDYYGDRGPAAGIDLDYERDAFYGLMRSYWVQDTGVDKLGGIRGDVEPPDVNRGRFLLRHRQYLPGDWEVTTELSYLSDRNFLEEYFNSEFNEGKEQEASLYAKKPLGENTIFSGLAKWRINDFLTQTEYLPEGRLDVLGKSFSDGRLIWFSENRLGDVRRRVDHDVPDCLLWLMPPLDSTRSVFRGDTRQEIDLPIDLDPFKLVGFTTLRGTAWDDSPFEGGLQRIYANYGLRGSTSQWRVFDNVESRLFDLHQLRHVMEEYFTVWAAHTNVNSSELTPFEQGIETLDDVDGASFGWRHRLQTKRGGPDHWRNVDWLTLDLQAGFFNDAETTNGQNRTRGQTFFYRPEESIASNYVSLNSTWRISDTTALLYDAIVDVNDGRLGSSGIGLHIDRDPRLSWFVGHRFIGLTNSNLLGFGANYRLNPKYTVSVREEFDLDQGRNANIAVTLVRRMPRWYFAVTLQFDDTEDVNIVNLSVWPEGIPEWAIGTQRYTGLETSTGLRR